MDEFRVSVIVPVYNAASFVTQAVESAIQQPEVGEVLLIEDGSLDGGLEVCEYLNKKYNQVRLLRHPGGLNRGASASRNLGIDYAKYPFIAFLDADDYYLPNRFCKTKQVFFTRMDADGVYEAIGTYFENREVQENYLKVDLPLLTTVKRNDIPPKILFNKLLKGRIGHFSLDGLTAKAKLIREVGYFDEQLEVHQDTDYIYRLSAIGLLYPGNISEPVAMRRVHGNNRITSHLMDRRKSYESGRKLWQALLKWGEKELNGSKFRWVVRRMFVQLRRIDQCGDASLQELLISRKNMFLLALKYPWAFVDPYCMKRFFPSRALIYRIIERNS